MKLTPGVNFINVFTSSFYKHRSQKLLNLTVFFALSGSAHVKAARKMLVKLTPCHRLNLSVDGLSEDDLSMILIVVFSSLKTNYYYRA